MRQQDAEVSSKSSELEENNNQSISQEEGKVERPATTTAQTSNTSDQWVKVEDSNSPGKVLYWNQQTGVMKNTLDEKDKYN